jgi:hypothetical protein
MSDRHPFSAGELGRVVRVATPNGEREFDIYSKEGFEVLSQLWTRSNWENRLSYEVTWLGIPIIQLPEDMTVMQELIWKVRPDVIVESGVAHGGALVRESECWWRSTPPIPASTCSESSAATGPSSLPTAISWSSTR